MSGARQPIGSGVSARLMAVASRPRRGCTAARALVALVTLLVGAGVWSPGAAPSHAATLSTASNPLAGGTWGVYTGDHDGIYPAWQAAAGNQRRLLARIALRARVRWFSAYISPGAIEGKVRDYITSTQGGDPNVLVQMAVFRVFPTGETHVKDPMTVAQQNSYRAWVDNAARGIGSARVALVLEPDLGVALQGWRPAVRLSLTAYAARVFGSLPRTSVYIDASAADWLRVPAATSMLRAAGVGHVRGFALNGTHYDSTASEIGYGQQIVQALARAGIPGRHFIINTADTGRPFTWAQYWAAHPHGNFDNAEVCRASTQQRCVTLGIPPTWQVTDPRWHLPTTVLTPARRYCDGYLWFGRPWMDNQASPFDLNRALAIAAATPFS